MRTRCYELSKIAREIGCPNIILVPSPTPDHTLGWSEVVGEYVKVLRDLSGIAGEYGIRLAFEFLGFGWCSVRTPRAAWEIVQQVERSNVGMAIDTAHFYAGGGLMQELDQLDGGRIFAFHLNDLEDGPKEAITDGTRLFPGEGVIPLGEICGRLKRTGYDGACSIELFRPEYWDWPPEQVAASARQTAIQVLSPYFELV
ncbi:MAG: sugar phosphate isomerase/epimerase [Chloroflexota bacterium]